jgi:NAD(P)-dependent dehydrogenase (short-subunit alcohol dehydrogenase family)
VHCASAPIDASLADLLSVNYSFLRLLRDAVLKSMLAKQDGRFVLIGSRAVDSLPAGWDNYIAAKAAAQIVVNGIAKHFGHLGVLAGTLAPSYVESPFSDGWRPAGEAGILPEFVAENVLRMLEEELPAYRILDAAGIRDQAGDAAAIVERVPSSQAILHRSSEPETSGRRAEGFAELDKVVRQTLELPQDSDLSTAGLGVTPSWDSLRHIQLIVAIEQELGLSFTSQEISRLMTYSDLTRICEQKLTEAGVR